MKTCFRTLAAVAGLHLACIASALGATAGLDTATPSVIDGVQNLNFSTNDATNTAIQYVPNDFLAGDNGAALGQTFTTGANSGGYSLSSISVRQVSWGTTYWDYTGGTVTLQIFQLNSTSGGVSNITQLALETATVGGEDDGITYSQGVPAAPRWLTVTLGTPVVLNPNAMYGFQIIASGTGANDQFFLHLDGTSTNSYAGGFALGTGKVSGQPDPVAVWDGNNGQPGDRAFVATMTGLTVPVPPVFVTQPNNFPGQVGGTVTLTATATGSPTPTYQWQYSPDGVIDYTDVLNGGSVSGAETQTLSINPAGFNQQGFYRVVATNTGGSENSNAVEVSLIYPAPVITTQPPGGAIQQGANVSLTVAATGLGTLSYQWYSANSGPLTDGGSVSGATTPTLTLSNIQPGDADNYHCVITDHKATEDASGESDTTAQSATATIEVFSPNSGLVSFEPFAAYPPGVELEGQNPTVNGFTNGWVNPGAFGQVTPITSTGSLVYSGSGYHAGIGGKVGAVADTDGVFNTNSGRVERLLATNLKATDLSSQTLYLSWLFKTGNEGSGTYPNNYQVLGLWNGTSGNDALRRFQAGIALVDFATGNYAFRVNGASGTPVNLGVAPDANVHLFVAKFVLNPAVNSDSVTVWIDPTLGAGEPTGGALVAGTNLAFDRLTISDYSGNSSQWDEIRWGTSFDSVTVTAPAVPLIPEFTLQPTGQNGTVGGSITLTGVALGDPSPDYQWQFDDGSGYVDLPGEIGESLVLQPTTYSQSGIYRLLASNVNGDTYSDEVFVFLSYPVPVITQQPQAYTGLDGSNATLNVAATGLGNLSYQWFKVDGGGDIQLVDGGNISGATTSALHVNGLTPTDEGQYYVVVSDDASVLDEGLPTQTNSNTVTVTVADLALTSSTTAPATDGFDQFYLPGTIAKANNINGGDDAATYVAFDRASKGMSFTTGSDPLGYTLNSISLQNVLHAGTFANVQNGDTFEFAFGTLSGNTKTVIYQSSKAVYLGDPIDVFNVAGTGRFFTFDLSGLGIATLSPNTTYYFEVTTQVGDPFFEWNGTSADSYAGGAAFGGSTTAAIDETFVAMTGDRAFIADLTGLSGPADDYAAWIALYPGVGGETGFGDDADDDGIENGLENFFGTDPGAATQGISQIAKSGNILTFQHPQNPNPASDVEAAYRWSSDLTNWFADGAANSGTTVTFSASPNTPTVGITTVTATITGNMPGKLFVDLEVTKQP